MPNVRVDIVTGRPAYDTHGETETGREKSDNERLYEKSRVAGIGQSEAAQIIIKEIESLLVHHVEAVLSEDKEVAAYLRILSTLGGKIITARKVVEEIMAKKRMVFNNTERGMDHHAG